MIIAKDTIVSLDVELSDLWGNLIQRSEEPLQYLHGGYGNMFPAAEAVLEGKQVDDRIEVRLEPEDAFGDYDESLLRVEPRNRFPEVLEVGMRFEGAAVGDDANLIFTVTEMAEDKVVLDANHALAGMGLKLSCSVVGVRRATDVEIRNGSADDPESVILRILP
ncbi:MAG: peptidylprolyl isomerase [Betaproteobacteria bacterium]|nr:MAG: peptidylprolyl isomerase [Betaproteobacteria bacterium]